MKTWPELSNEYLFLLVFLKSNRLDNQYYGISVKV